MIAGTAQSMQSMIPTVKASHVGTVAFLSPDDPVCCFKVYAVRLFQVAPFYDERT